MSSAAYQNPTITMDKNVRNVTDSYNLQCVESLWDIGVGREWPDSGVVLPFSPLGRAEREGRVDEVGDCLLRTNKRVRGRRKGGDQVVSPVIVLSFCYGEPGVGKKDLRCENYR